MDTRKRIYVHLHLWSTVPVLKKAAACLSSRDSVQNRASHTVAWHLVWPHAEDTVCVDSVTVKSREMMARLGRQHRCSGFLDPNQRRMLHPLELELRLVVSCHVGARNRTWVL